jgi:hypothetical protein
MDIDSHINTVEVCFVQDYIIFIKETKVGNALLDEVKIILVLKHHTLKLKVITFLTSACD